MKRGAHITLNKSPYLFDSVKLRVARWQPYDLAAPLTDGAVNLVLKLWTVLPAEEKQLRTSGSRYDGNLFLMFQPPDEVHLPGGCGRASTLLFQLAVVWCST